MNELFYKKKTMIVLSIWYRSKEIW